MECIINRTVFERVQTKNKEGEFSIIRDKYYVLVFVSYIGKYRDNYNKERFVDPLEANELRKNNVSVTMTRKTFYVFVHKDVYHKNKLNERLKCGYTYKLKVTIKRFINRFTNIPKGCCFYLINLKNLGNDQNLYHSYLYLTLDKNDLTLKKSKEGNIIYSTSKRGTSSYISIEDEKSSFDMIVPIYLFDGLINTISDQFNQIIISTF